MAEQKAKTTREKKNQKEPRPDNKNSRCSLPHVVERELGINVNPNRARLIQFYGKKWVNGTVLHYYFFNQQTDGQTVFFSDGTSEWRTWKAKDAEKEIVRKAFGIWEKLGIGLKFEEVNSRDEAEIRIGFMKGDGAWSYIGRDILTIGKDERTMNFGWSLTSNPNEIDTAVHEIGHTLGFPHEHQNPNAGIVWDEEAVYTALAQPPNSWDREKTFYNIIRKIDPDSVQGSSWDPDSIMHYPFGAGMIKEPEKYKNGIHPAAGLSERDKTWVKTFYPPLTKDDYEKLLLLRSVRLNIAAGEQKNYIIQPTATRYYDISTFGTSDTIMVLFEDFKDELRYITADDDSGEDYNASVRVKLFKNSKYILRIRFYYSDRTGETAVMIW